MADTLINRVAASGIITVDLENYYPTEDICVLDLKDYLFRELVLREKDFRTAMKEHKWDAYDGKHLIVTCSTDAIIPMWAYMLIATYATNALSLWCGSKADFISHHFEKVIDSFDTNDYIDKRIVIKGCGDKDIPPQAYCALTRKLLPVAKSVMFGEPCSTVPIYKQPKK